MSKITWEYQIIAIGHFTPAVPWHIKVKRRFELKGDGKENKSSTNTLISTFDSSHLPSFSCTIWNWTVSLQKLAQTQSRVLSWRGTALVVRVGRVCPVGSHWAATCLHTGTRSRFIRVGEPEVTACSISLHPSCSSAASHNAFCTRLPVGQLKRKVSLVLMRQQLICPSVRPSFL